MPQLRLYAAKLIKINVKKKKEVHSFGFLKKKKKKKSGTFTGRLKNLPPITENQSVKR